MNLSQPAIIAIAAGVLAVCALGEWFHARRVSRVARLAFGGIGRPNSWTRAIPVARAVSASAVCWSLLTLMSIDGAPASPDRGRVPERHLIVALDVSPSMYIPDAGPTGRSTRQHRAADLIQSVLDRLDMSRARVTVIAFYSSARPVVIDTADLAVVSNILYDLPLAQAFKDGKTDMYSAVEASGKVAERWTPGSATLLLVSDGDTLPPRQRPTVPPSIADAIIVGVGNPFKASNIGDDLSRQDSATLKRFAAQLGGIYHDGNAGHLPTRTLHGLTMMNLKASRADRLRLASLTTMALSACMIAAVSPLLAAFGAPEVDAGSSRRRKLTPVTGLHQGSPA
ncbi:MAG: vWA domain-containing protein [Phycisphaerales bacterium]